MEYKLSIIILCFNKYNFTKSCLNDLFKLPEDHQIIVVDNASSDETQTELSKIEKPNFRYIRSATNLGFAGGCNLGASLTEAPAIMFLNNDIRVKSQYENWTDLILNELENDILVGPTGGFVDPKNNFQFMYETNDPNKPINYMSGWCLTMNRATMERLKIERKSEDDSKYNQYWNEEYFCYFEDADISQRARKLKMKFKLVSIPVVHFGKVSSSQLNVSSLYLKAKQVFVSKWSK